MSVEMQMQMRRNVEQMHQTAADLEDFIGEIGKRDANLRGVAPTGSGAKGGKNEEEEEEEERREIEEAKAELRRLSAEQDEAQKKQEKAAGEKVLYCSACDNGPFNTKGMRMHISRWCTFAAGKPTADPNIVPTAVADPERSTRDAAVRITAHLAPSGTANDPNHKGSLDMPNHKAALKTFVCSACGAGPFNEKGMAMHASRWCKAKDNLDDVDANYVAAFGGALAQQAQKHADGLLERLDMSGPGFQIAGLICVFL